MGLIPRQLLRYPDGMELSYVPGTHYFDSHAYHNDLDEDEFNPLKIVFRLRVFFRRVLNRMAREAEALFYAPGGPGYLQAREDFQIRAGQRRATRRYQPY